MKVFDRQLNEVSTVTGGFGGINDFEWYPWMNWGERSGCCFATVSKNLPIQLWEIKEEPEACSTVVRSSWVAKDHLDQVSTCHSVTVSPEGKFIVAGGKASIWCFDITRPGGYSLIPRSTISNRKRKDGQTGIISNITFRNDTSNVFAACSFDNSISIYDLRSLQNDAGEKTSSCLSFLGHSFGCSQAKFLSDGWSLVSMGRKERCFKIWDIRKLGDEINCPVVTVILPYTVPSNQRIYFDTDRDDSIVIGSGPNLMRFKNNTQEVLVSGTSIVSSASVNSAQVIAFTEGSRPRRYIDDDDDDDDSSSDGNIFRINIL